MPVKSAEEAVAIAKRYARETSARLFWKDVLECAYEEEKKAWRVIYQAAPSVLSPYYTYEVLIDAETGEVISSRRLAGHAPQG